MKLLLLSRNDIFLSRRINKHPNNQFKRDLGNGSTVSGVFEESGAYSATVEHDLTVILKHCKQTNKASYNDAVFWLAGPYNLKGYNELFRSALRNKYDVEIPAEHVDDKCQYTMKIGPVSHYNANQINRLTAGMNLVIAPVNQFEKSTVCNLLITAESMKLSEFLQKIYLFLYAYQYHFTLGVDTNEKLGQFKLMFSSWIEQLENKNYFIECLAGKRLYKLEKLDEEYGASRVETVEGKVANSLHTKRHQLIAETINGLDGIQTILDVGCGSGQLLRHLGGTKAQYIGIDCDINFKGQGKKLEKVKFIETNILFPRIPGYCNDNSVMVLSEVLEHFDDADRQSLYNLIENFYQPDVLIVTTPNFEYNVNYGLTGYRHKDHKIEFDKETIRELFDNLPAYVLAETKQLTDESVQPSFCFVFKRVGEKYDSTITMEIIEKLHSQRNTKVLCDNVIVKNHRNIFYLGPTIAPAASDIFALESTSKAEEYYLDKGVSDLTYQVKVMGSRAYILWFRTKQHAAIYGYDNVFLCNSKNGFAFFDDEQIKNVLYEELAKLVPSDVNVVMLDCEITPWAYKAEGLISNMFNIPLYAELLHFEFNSQDDPVMSADVRIAIEELHKYDNANEQIKVHIFDLLFADNRNLNGLSIIETLSILNGTSDYYEVVKSSNNLNDLDSILDVEGIVIKPSYRVKGLLPALKVRNPNFLRLIYGAHYYDYFDLLSGRTLGKKRAQSHNQYVNSLAMIDAFANKSNYDRLASVIAFLNEERHDMDATL